MIHESNTGELCKRLVDATAKLALLAKELEVSRALVEFFPDVYEHGSVRVNLTGGSHRGMKYHITRGDGSHFEWPVAAVPKKILLHFLDGMKGSDTARLRREVLR